MGLQHLGLATQADGELPGRPGAFTVRTLAAVDVPAQPAAAAPQPATPPMPAAQAGKTPRPTAALQAMPQPAPAPGQPAEDAARAPVEDDPPAPEEAPAADTHAELPAPEPTVAQTDPGPDPAAPEPADLPLVMAAAATAVAPAAARAETVEVPVYPTRLAAAFSARYRLQRGMLGGTGTLRWAPSADGRRYEARLDGSVAGFNVLDWTSTGAIDRAGVAPERFLVRRRGRDAQAANFQRGAGKITYSGPSVQYDLPTGAQDRLSWMLQLGGVLNASPKRFGVGSRLSFFVSGARGDADLWQFSVVGLENVPGGGGRDTLALKLVREPRKAYDTHVEVWLDPAREHRPVLARLSTAGNDDALELRLAD
ncbi:DUF3108 domain-containing protein [Aquincola sp. J276]|uniref:DUF3108 domain-containing protein n=1 Tax=Aquincola sp. J276 TaxID=2898432 RepID=UPI00215166CD|nr:DUF3108 domain-containing protein [Aquincola sp. J276]MCR5866282.1 DUF3108 domain-containing protein [Aquincola sp. J276]